MNGAGQPPGPTYLPGSDALFLKFFWGDSYPEEVVDQKYQSDDPGAKHPLSGREIRPAQGNPDTRCIPLSSPIGAPRNGDDDAGHRPRQRCR